MELIRTTKGTYDAMNIIRSTFNCVGSYEFTHSDGELIEGYEYKGIDEDSQDEFTPIIKVECSDGYFYATNYKNDVKNRL
ncbi:hypothetical protein [Bacillus phage SDFMU_Pbc]|uniref:Uncharacterized protein n=1 Tax=Bacillus phage SDFMU_Pbc TaxID=3076135 RepID=A0AA96KR30_9CAUD|nr:hypothetical protein [Bacillus phage SDFMU_Pbc]